MQPLRARIRSGVLALLCAACLIAAPATAAPARPSAGSEGLVINEIDYVQRDGVDDAEFVELLNVGKDPIQLGEHVLVGVDRSATIYRRLQLPAHTLLPGEYYVLCGQLGKVPNCDTAVAVRLGIWQDSKSGLAPNAVAILRGQDELLVDSVSYEGDVPRGPSSGGSWTETQGVDPGDDANADNLGLSRTPDGNDSDDNAGDFSRRCITPGAANGSQGTSCAPPVGLPGLVINEVDYVQPSQEDEAEFVELRNTGDTPIELSRYALLGLDASGKEYRRVSLTPQRLAPGGYFVVCGPNGRVPNCDMVVGEPRVDLWRDSRTRGGTPAAIGLVKASSVQSGLDLLVDSVSYEGSVDGGPLTGGSWTETAGVTKADRVSELDLGISRSPDGADSGVNADDFAPRCITPGGPNGSLEEVCPPATSLRGLVINEVDYAQQGAADEAEFVELRNVGQTPVDLGDYDLLGVNAVPRVYRTIELPSHSLQPGAYFVVCTPNATVPNCNLPTGPKSNALQDRFRDTSPINAVALMRNPTGDPRDDVLVDSVSYDGSLSGGPLTGGTWTEGSGIDPGDDNRADFVSIARLPDGVDVGDNSDDFGQGCTTPGYANIRRPLTAACPPSGLLTATPTLPPLTGTPPSPTPSPTATATDLPPRESPTPTATDLPPRETATPSATSPSPTPGGGGRLTVVVVDDISDAVDASPGDGVCKTALGSCTLRAALETVNADPGGQAIRIVFDVAGDIEVPLSRALPTLTRAGVTIDGRRPGGPLARAAAPRSAAPLDLQQAGCTPGQGLTGLGRGSGLSLAGASQAVMGLRIEGFEIGVELLPGAVGVRVGSDGDGLRDPEECNVLWDNRMAQLRIAGRGASGNQVSGNRIGVDPTDPDLRLVRAAIGVDIVEGAADNVVGTGLSRSGAVVGLGNLIQNSSAGVRVGGAGSSGNRIMGNLIGAFDRSAWEAHANVVGVLLASGASNTWIGGPADVDSLPAGLANQVAYNLAAGIAVERGVTGTSIRDNHVFQNRRDGIRLAQTRTGANTLRGNSIHGNGGAAIAVEPEAPQLAPPTIVKVDSITGVVNGKACAGCLVELFADDTNEAQLPLRRGTADASGDWSMSGLDLLGLSQVHLTATATDGGGNTSRLSGTAALGERWRMIEIPPAVPRVLRLRERSVERVYRLLDGRDQPVVGALVVFSPIDLRLSTGAAGLLQVRIPFADALRANLRSSSFTVEAVDSGGRKHPVQWYPQLVAARAEPAPVPGGTLLDLSGVGPDGIGGLLKRLPGAGPFAGLAGIIPARAFEPLQGETTDAYGAAFAAAPTTELREGQYAWQENLARGGGIYELHPADGETLSGELEIVAPIAAFDAGKPASACSADPQGAVIAGWQRDERCWVPMPGTTASAPPPNATTFIARGELSISATGFSLLSRLQASTSITLYTVGFDTTPPELKLSIASGARLSQLPAVLGTAVDADAGVRAATGLVVTLDGQPVPVSLDAASGEIRVAAADRVLPPGLLGAVDLSITVDDGFCNQNSSTISVILDPNAPPPDDRRTLYIPSLFQRRQ